MSQPGEGHTIYPYLLKGLEVTGVPQNNKLNHESWGIWISGSNNTFEQINTHHHMGPGLFIQNGGSAPVMLTYTNGVIETPDAPKHEVADKGKDKKPPTAGEPEAK